MNFSHIFVSYCATIALAFLSIALLLVIVRIVKGPTLPDRIVGLDMLVTIGISFIAVIAVKTGFDLYLDIAIALGLVGFLATVAFARFVLRSDHADNHTHTQSMDSPKERS